MAASAMANRIEIFGTVSAETLEELAAMAIRLGLSLSAGGQKCGSADELRRAAAVAQRNLLPLVLHCTGEGTAYVGIEHLLKASNIPYQVVAPFRSECGEYMARLYDGIAEFLRVEPMERGLRFKLAPEAPNSALQAA